MMVWPCGLLSGVGDRWGWGHGARLLGLQAIGDPERLLTRSRGCPAAEARLHRAPLCPGRADPHLSLSHFNPGLSYPYLAGTVRDTVFEQCVSGSQSRRSLEYEEHMMDGCMHAIYSGKIQGSYLGASGNTTTASAR